MEEKQTLAQLGNGTEIEGVVTEKIADEKTLSISIRLDKENLVKCLDFLVEIGLVEKITELTPSEQ